MVDTAQLFDRLTRVAARRPSALILELDLTEGIVDGVPGDPLSALLTHRRVRLQEVVDGLRRAARDDRVRVLVAKLGGRGIGFAKIQEVREAVTAFRAAGKPAIAWAETFGEFGPGNLPYYLATAFERIYLQPSGDLGLTGVAIEERFLRGSLDKLGVDPQLGKRHEYKNAANTFAEHGFTPEHREATGRVAASLNDQVVAGVAVGRGLTEQRVRELVNGGPYLGPEAVDAGLVDGLCYRDEVYALARKQAGSGDEPPGLMYLTRYQRAQTLANKIPHPREQGIALIHGTGPVRLGRSGRGPLTSGAMGSDTVTAAFRSAVRDDKIKAIVFRVDSPGGSYVASDAIWREVARTRAAGKPVIVSMGDVAASGGYFVAMGADAIVAGPGTLTGSIGVVGGKMVVGDLLTRLGVDSDGVEEGANAAMFSTAHGFTPAQWARVNAWLDRVYDDFVGKVAQGRRMSREQVHEVARGRVWTGADARERGLVDELGGLDRAAELAREHAGLPTAAPLRPHPRVHPLERLRPAESSEDRAAAAAVRLEAWGPLAGVAARAGLPAGGPLMLPGWWEIH